LGKDGCGVGRITEGDGKGCIGWNVVERLNSAIALIVKGDFTVGFGAVIELCGVWKLLIYFGQKTSMDE
jgi:hypothetical protein